jgi:hypothetical protein
MPTHAEATLRPGNTERPDAHYAFVAGLYVTALVVPDPVIAFARLRWVLEGLAASN